MTKRAAEWWGGSERLIGGGRSAGAARARPVVSGNRLDGEDARPTHGGTEDRRPRVRPKRLERDGKAGSPRSRRRLCGRRAPAELGDTSAVDIFYDEWKSRLGRPGVIHESQIAFYLCKHGGRREWELLHAISVSEVRDGKGPGAGAVWACVVNSGRSGGSPYAIPILALALGETQLTGSRFVDARLPVVLGRGHRVRAVAETARQGLRLQTQRHARRTARGHQAGSGRGSPKGRRNTALITSKRRWSRRLPRGRE